MSLERMPKAAPGAVRATAAGLLGALLAGAAFAGTAHASDPMGIYSLVEDVAVEPGGEGTPAAIRIYGVHALAYRPQSGSTRGQGLYTEPDEGYLYFRCGAADAEACALEWKDLQAAVGDDRCAAYGHRYLTDPEPNGRLRSFDEAPEDPDSYPIGQGVVMVSQGDWEICEALRAFAASRGAPSPEPSEAPATTEPPTAPPAEPSEPVPATPVPATPVPPEAKPSPGDKQGSLPALLPQVQNQAPGGAGPIQSGSAAVEPGPRPMLGLLAALALGALALGAVLARRGRSRG